MAFGLVPRTYSDKEEENIIYDEEDEVLEMYFITKGTVGVGFHTYQQPLEEKPFNITHQLNLHSFFGDYYILSNTKAEFVHIAQTPVEAFALSRKFLVGKVFPKYPEIYEDMCQQSSDRYHHIVKAEVQTHKQTHIETVNKCASYSNIQIDKKDEVMDMSHLRMMSQIIPKVKGDFGAQRIREQF